MNTIFGIDNLRKELERQRGDMSRRTVIPASDKFGERTTGRLCEATEKAEFANGSHRGGSIAAANVEHKPNCDTK